MSHRPPNFFVSLMLIAVIALSSVAPVETITHGQGKYRVYFPITLTPKLQLHGSVTYHGQPIAGIPVRLFSCIAYFRFGSVCGLYRTVTTDFEGRYNFVNVSTLQPDSNLGGYFTVYMYRITYDSQDLASPPADALASWWLPDIDEYTAGTTVHAGDFDIGGLVPIVPYNAAILPAPSGPTTTTLFFRWTPRENAPTLGYQVGLYSDDPNYLFDSGSDRLGSSDTYSMTLGYSPTCEPYRLCPNRVYTWGVNIYDTQTGFYYGATQAYTFTLALP